MRDSTGGTPDGNPDVLSAQFGWDGGQTPGDSLLLYFTSATYHVPQYPYDMFWDLEFEIADGALAITAESNSCYGLQDTSHRTNNPYQTLLIDRIENGFTYGVGDTDEPGTGSIVQPRNLPKAMRMDGCTFVKAGQMSSWATGYRNIALGDPLGMWRDETQPPKPNGSVAFTNRTSQLIDSVYCTITTPYVDDMDSAYVDVFYTEDEIAKTETLTKILTGPDTTVIFSYEKEDINIDSIRIIVMDKAGNLSYRTIVSETVESPTLLHTPPDTITTSDEEVEMLATAYALDNVPIDSVWLTYRIWPDTVWQDVGLTRLEEDDEWLIELELNQKGGVLEYWITGEDDADRTEYWPARATSDTVTHTINILPLVTELTDTLYIYCPNTLMNSIEVQSYGVLYILPTNEDEEHILTVYPYRKSKLIRQAEIVLRSMCLVQKAIQS